MENIDLGFWIILVVTGLVFAIIGYLIGKSQSNSKELTATVEQLTAANNQLQTELKACQENLSEQSVQSGRGTYHFDSKSAKAVFGKFIHEDDLKIVEGIGPKIEGLFHNYNIKTWKALSKVSVAKCREVLDSGGEKYRLHDPASWPMQAKMCYEGRWKELYRWQVEHKHGKL